MFSPTLNQWITNLFSTPAGMEMLSVFTSPDQSEQIADAHGSRVDLAGDRAKVHLADGRTCLADALVVRLNIDHLQQQPSLSTILINGLHAEGNNMPDELQEAGTLASFNAPVGFIPNLCRKQQSSR